MSAKLWLAKARTHTLEDYSLWVPLFTVDCLEFASALLLLQRAALFLLCLHWKVILHTAAHHHHCLMTLWVLNSKYWQHCLQKKKKDVQVAVNALPFWFTHQDSKRQTLWQTSAASDCLVRTESVQLLAVRSSWFVCDLWVCLPCHWTPDSTAFAASLPKCYCWCRGWTAAV